ncbi:flagellar assembly protein T N-terminal domain-containing protein [Paracoccaceae bacterium]|nr:flagellar assembly protein T N-terminal domain-containing protein [Paracoccaceae bacterium]
MQLCQKFFKRLTAASITVLILAASGAYGANVIQILATGRAAISEDMTQKARRHALEDALYMAALKVGADISSTAITSQGVLVRDVIKLDTEGRLVDFTIIGEKNTGTHYEVKLNAFFAKKSNEYCPKPRYPSVTMLAPNIEISETVDFRYTDLAELIVLQFKDSFESSYAGTIFTEPTIKIKDIQSNASKHLLFDYNSIQSGNLSSVSVDGDYLINTSINMRMDGRRIESQLLVFVLNQSDLTPLLTLEQEFTSNLHLKTPLRAINVLWPKWLNIEQNKITQLSATINEAFNDIACRQLEAKIMLVSGKLKLGIGSSAGLKNGSLAYVTQGQESWALLEVASVTENSSTLRPINNVQNIQRLANQKIRFIEGALR